MRSEGVSGPYGIALGPRCYTGLTRSTSRGYPIINHVRELLDGPIVWAPAADGAVVLSLRGGDFELTVGQDFSIGYLDHTEHVGAAVSAGDVHVSRALAAGGGAAHVSGGGCDSA